MVIKPPDKISSIGFAEDVNTLNENLKKLS